MDPNETLRQLELLLKGEANELCEALWDWCQKGGFEPKWHQYKIANEFLDFWYKQIKKGE